MAKPAPLHYAHESGLKCTLQAQAQGCVSLDMSAGDCHWGSEERLIALQHRVKALLEKTDPTCGVSYIQPTPLQSRIGEPVDACGHATVAELLWASFATNKARPCVSTAERTLSYGEVWDCHGSTRCTVPVPRYATAVWPCGWGVPGAQH